jgi:uncharacterized coiled-coil protein SlyX
MHEKPRDYVGANRVKIRQLMKKVKEREAQTAEKSKTEPVKALWKSDKYNNVTSKLKQMLEVMTHLCFLQSFYSLSYIFRKRPPHLEK